MRGKTKHDLIKIWNDRRAQNKTFLPISWATIIGNTNLFKENAAIIKSKQPTNVYFLKITGPSWISQLFNSSPSANLLTNSGRPSSRALTVSWGSSSAKFFAHPLNFTPIIDHLCRSWECYVDWRDLDSTLFRLPSFDSSHPPFSFKLGRSLEIFLSRFKT